LDFSCSGLDNAGPLLFGTPAGIRNMIGMVGFGGTPANPAEIGDGVSIGEGAGSTISWKRGFRMAGRFSQAVFDTRQAVAQGGSAHAVWLADGHTIALDTAGTTTLGASGGRVAFGGTGTGFNGTAPVARPTGWGAPTGTATRTTFATSTVLLPALAEHVKALIDDLTAYGLIGS
jgi:hypothetical protein